MNSPVLKYYNINDGVTAFSSTRKGGCSKGCYGEFNINAFCGDSPQAVETNRKALCRELGIGTDLLVVPHQTHGTCVRQITDSFLKLYDSEKERFLDGVDAVMTDVRGLCIGVSTADCIPILLYSPAGRVSCAIHAGWRGTVESIAMKAVVAMNEAYGTSPADLRAVIGPGISKDKFEVGDEVWLKFEQAGFSMDTISSRYDKWHIDLWECNRLQLVSAGLQEQNISVAGICTYTNSSEFFSARRLGIASGRIFSGIIIR